MQKVSVDGVEYNLEELSTEARQVLAHTAAAEQEIRHLQMQLVLMQAARATFASTLKGLLPSK